MLVVYECRIILVFKLLIDYELLLLLQGMAQVPVAGQPSSFASHQSQHQASNAFFPTQPSFGVQVCAILIAVISVFLVV